MAAVAVVLVLGVVVGAVALFATITVREFELTTGKDGRPEWIRKRRSVSRRKKKKRSTVKLVQMAELSEGLVETQQEGAVVKHESVNITPVEPKVEATQIEKAPSTNSSHERNKLGTKELSIDKASVDDKEVDDKEVDDKEVDDDKEEDRETVSIDDDIEEGPDHELLFTKQIPLGQGDKMMFFAVYDKDAYFATAFDNQLKLTALKSMQNLPMLQKRELMAMAVKKGEHLTHFATNNGIFLIAAKAPSNTISLFRMYHQLSKTPTLLHTFETGFPAAKELVNIAYQTISAELGVLVAAVDKEVRIWEVNTKNGKAEGEATDVLESGVEKMVLYGNNDIFRTMHPGMLANGETVYLAVLTSANEILLKGIETKKTKKEVVIDVKNLLSISTFAGSPIEIVSLAMDTRSVKSSKFMLCGTADGNVCLYKKVPDKNKPKQNNGKPGFMAKELLTVPVKAGEPISALAITTKRRLFSVGVGKDIYIYSYHHRTRTQNLVLHIPEAHTSKIIDMVISPAEGYLATREMLNNRMKIWDLSRLPKEERMESVLSDD